MMNKESRSNTVLILVLVTVSCLILLCAAVAILFFFFGFSPAVFTVEETPTETTTLSAAQLEQCREVMTVQPGVEIEGEYFLYTPGFLDDSMECHLRVHADSLEDVFDTAVINPSLTTDQEIAPGRYLRLKIEIIEPDLYRIEGFWYQT